MGHKLITGISNSPQTRWERVRAPVPVPRQADRSASPYRRRITPRLISNIPTTSTAQVFFLFSFYLNSLIHTTSNYSHNRVLVLVTLENH